MNISKNMETVFWKEIKYGGAESKERSSQYKSRMTRGSSFKVLAQAAGSHSNRWQGCLADIWTEL